MKKSILLLLTLISLAGFVNAQNPQWLNYTNGDIILALSEEGNNMWVGTYGGGLVKLDKTTGIPTFYNKANSGLPDNLVLSIAIDENGTKWIGTEFGGLAAFDGTNWTTYNTSNSGLPDNWVSSIAIDKNGTKWIGTGFGGLAVYNENGIPDYVKENAKEVGRVNIFPNPADNKLNIELLDKINISYVEIINMKGCLIKRQSVANTQQTIDVSWLPSGIYVLRIYTEKGIINKKLIKQ